MLTSILTLSTVLLAAGAKNPLPADPAPRLPEWHGQWRGTLTIAGAAQTIPMGLDIEPIEGRDALAWRIIYGEGSSRQVRDYELLPGDAPGRFVIDEKNGILLDARLEGGVLVSAFEVQGNTLVARYELRGEELRYEILTWANAAQRESVAGEGPEAIRVRAFPVGGYQRAALRPTR